MPTIFAAYADTAYKLDQMGMVVDLKDYLTEDEKAAFVPGYITEGDFDGSGSIKIFPVAKSTELMFFNDTDWQRFAKENLCALRCPFHHGGCGPQWPSSTTTGPAARRCLAGTRWQTICLWAQSSWAAKF